MSANSILIEESMKSEVVRRIIYGKDNPTLPRYSDNPREYNRVYLKSYNPKRKAAMIAAGKCIECGRPSKTKTCKDCNRIRGIKARHAREGKTTPAMSRALSAVASFNGDRFTCFALGSVLWQHLKNPQWPAGVIIGKLGEKGYIQPDWKPGDKHAYYKSK